MGYMREKKPKANMTAPFVEEYRGAKVFAIYPIKEDGSKYSEFARVSFGLSKAKLIVKHLEDLKEFIKTYEGEE